MTKQHVKLSESDKQKLESLRSKGSLKARKSQRVIALLELDRGKTYQEVSKIVGISHISLSKWAAKYKSVGLVFLDDQARSGRPKDITALQRAKITALACSEAPQGHAKWTLRLLADKIVELGYVESISHTGVRKILKKTL